MLRSWIAILCLGLWIWRWSIHLPFHSKRNSNSIPLFNCAVHFQVRLKASGNNAVVRNSPFSVIFHHSCCILKCKGMEPGKFRCLNSSQAVRRLFENDFLYQPFTLKGWGAVLVQICQLTTRCPHLSFGYVFERHLWWSPRVFSLSFSFFGGSPNQRSSLEFGAAYPLVLFFDWIIKEIFSTIVSPFFHPYKNWIENNRLNIWKKILKKISKNSHLKWITRKWAVPKFTKSSSIFF